MRFFKFSHPQNGHSFALVNNGASQPRAATAWPRPQHFHWWNKPIRSRTAMVWRRGPALKQGVVLKPARAVVALWGLNWVKEPGSHSQTVTLTPSLSLSCSHWPARSHKVTSCWISRSDISYLRTLTLPQRHPACIWLDRSHWDPLICWIFWIESLALAVEQFCLDFFLNFTIRWNC